jgi:hypothetical protein
MGSITERVQRKLFRQIVLPIRRAAWRSPADELPTPFTGLLETLADIGTAVTTLDALGIGESEDMYASARELMHTKLARAAAAHAEKSYVIHADDADLLQRPEIIRWGLNVRILDFVERYLKLPVAYRGVVMRRDLANGALEGTRLWHKDDEDDRIVKIIVYLNDVDAGTGPFEYVSRESTPDAGRVHLEGGRVSEKEMRQLVPASAVRSCTGNAGTVVITDTCNVYHRGALPLAKDRYTLFYAYNSVHPRQPQHCDYLFDRAAFERLSPGLTPRQSAALHAY